MPFKDASIRRKEDYRKQYDITVAFVNEINRKGRTKAFATLGPYPVDLVHLSKRMPLERAKEILIHGMDIAAQYVEEGKAIALGEIGRPHFPAGKEVMDASNDILVYGLGLAKELGCAAVLHVEGGGMEVYASLAELADKAGINREKVVRHFSTPIIDTADNHNLFPSVLARKGSVEKAIRTSTRFMLETDYIDDLRRPGAVLGPATVPKRTLALLDKGVLSEDDCLAIHKDNPEKVYGIEMI